MRKRLDIDIAGIAPGPGGEAVPELANGEIKSFPDYRLMLDETRPEAAIVSPIFGYNAEVSIECIKRGINVLCEKPVAVTEEELDRLERTVKESSVRFSAMHYLRFSPAFYEGARLTKAGVIGKPVLITAQKSYRWGTDRPEWYSDRKLYGGTIPWIGIHAIDWIYAFTGMKFASVSAIHTGRPERTALCQYELENGAMASVSIDYYRPDGSKSHGDDRIRAVGDKGIVEISGGNVTLITEKEETTYRPSFAPDLTLDFLDGKETIPMDEIFYLTRIALASRDAADSGRKIMTGEIKL